MLCVGLSATMPQTVEVPYVMAVVEAKPRPWTTLSCGVSEDMTAVKMMVIMREDGGCTSAIYEDLGNG